MKIRYLLLCLVCLNPQVSGQEPVDLVYPLLDAANSRWIFFSSACRPFGLVNLSPDTEVDGAWGSGYLYNTEEIKGFSHIHAWQLSGVSVMPISGSELRKLGARKLSRDFYSGFSHKTEEVKPGFHRVYLDRYKAEVELTSTRRVGFHRIRFEENMDNAVLVSLSGKLGPSEMVYGELRRSGPGEVEGMVLNDKTIRRPKKTPVFFCIRFNREICTIHSFSGESVDSVAGEKEGAFLELAPGSDPVLMKVGISYVSAEQARLNMELELPHWDFDRVKQGSSEEWNLWLGSIRVEGGSLEDRRRFYTDLWHALLGRRIISDANGKYSDMTGIDRRIGQIPLDPTGNPAFNHHNSDSFWGAQWTLNTLWHLVYPQVTSDFCNSLLTYYSDGGLIPRGPSGGNYTYVMTGASSTPFLVSAYQKGIRDFDINLAYEGIKKNHLPGGMMDHSGYEHRETRSGGAEPYMENGYVPFPYKPAVIAYHKKGAGQTLEYAFQDWTLAQLAHAVGKEEDYRDFLERSKNYRNIYDPETGFMRPRNKQGDWLQGFDPGKHAEGFVESNSYQSTWFVPHDYDGLAELMGGKEILVKRLNKQFEEASEWGFTAGKKHADETLEENRRVPINYGNQPSIQTAYIFNEAGAPWLTQKWSRAVIDSVYSGLSPQFGYNGDEDQGLMGSLAVLMKIGLFQLNGGTDPDPVYQIGSPIFDRITIHLSEKYYSGSDFIIETENNSDTNLFIQAAYLNGQELDRLFIRHSEIVEGGHLMLIMGPEPNEEL